jgi:RND family efflux transporter MFP subunit
MARIRTAAGTMALLVVLVAAGATAWWRAAPEVTLAHPSRGSAVQAVYATGTVEPVQWAKVTPLVRGRIVELCKCEGEDVKRGDFLARLDTGEAEAEISELKARVQYLAEDVERYRALLARGTVSRQSFDRAVSDHDQARAALAAARERRDNLILRAPMAGTVLRRDGEVGEVVDPGQVLFWVGQATPLWIVAEVDEEDIPVVAAGQKTLIKADAFPDRELTGTVGQITPKGDPVSKAYRVRIDLPADTLLLIGMTTEINIVAAEKADALLVPTTAVARGAVFVVEDDRLSARPVTIGIRGDDRTEIESGLSGNERVVVGAAGLEAGTRVRIAGEPPPWASLFR